MTAANVNGVTLEYEVHGDADAEPLLLVMGLGGQLTAWPLAFVELLVQRGFRVIRFDNRDVGLSTKIDAPTPSRRQVVLSVVSRRFAKAAYTLDDMADDAASLLEHLEIRRAHVVGVSMGGMISQSVAIRHPHRVASLTSIMSNTGDRRHGKISMSLMRKMPRLLSREPDEAIDNGIKVAELISGPHFDPAATRELLSAAFQRSYDAAGTARQTMAINASPDRTRGLGSVRVPTLVIHGLVDPLVTPSGGIATARAVPGARLVMYPDMGHDLPLPRWDEIVEEIARTAGRAATSDISEGVEPQRSNAGGSVTT
ncbi:MAG: alpha/beta fold hydrolase [Acidimicrobiia bacterium]